MKISFLSDNAADYSTALGKVESLDDLKKLLKEFEPIAWDALDVVNAWDNDSKEERFLKFKRSMAKEKKGIFSNDEIAGIIIMPETMFKVSLTAVRFNAPWGCAFLRMKEVGLIEDKGGRFHVIEKPKGKK